MQGQCGMAIGHELMHPIVWSANERALWLAPSLAGWVLGTALQLQQPVLWPATFYALALTLTLGVLLAVAIGR